MSRKRIIADYERRMDGQGREIYIYTGPVFSLALSEAQLSRYRLACWLAPLVMIALYVAIGLLNTQSMHKFYVVFPFIALMMPLALLLSDAYKLSTNRKEMQRKEYLRCIVQMRRCTVTVLIFAVLLALGQLGVILFESVESVRMEWFFFAGCLCIGIVAALFWTAQKRVKTTEYR